MKRVRDLRSASVKRIVALGESTTWGYSVSDKKDCWANRVVDMIEKCQGQKVEFINQGIGANVLTPLCPAYEASAKPSALERVEGDVIAYKPDLVFLSYGLNDSRGGTPVEVFRNEYQKLIDRIKEGCGAIIVLLNVYYMHESMYRCYDESWNHSDYNVAEVYNKAIEQLAADNNLILADIYSAMEGVDWIIDQDHCHPNYLGHLIVANKVFESIVRNASFVANAMPKEPNTMVFLNKYENGPDKPSCLNNEGTRIFTSVKEAFEG